MASKFEIQSFIKNVFGFTINLFSNSIKTNLYETDVYIYTLNYHNIYLGTIYV